MVRHSARSRAEYEAWYPVFGASGLVVPNWPVEYGGLGVANRVARLVEAELRPYNLGRLNPLGLNLCAPALFHGQFDQGIGAIVEHPLHPVELALDVLAERVRDLEVLALHDRPHWCTSLELSAALLAFAGAVRAVARSPAALLRF